ncbi:hypothetical protein SAMN05880545_1159 [Microbacterium sp. RU33B]|nr:hypothetical protein SAMN05880545_1159 [Microbacterium sp. RU33B]
MMLTRFVPGMTPVAHPFRGEVRSALATGFFIALTPAAI